MKKAIKWIVLGVLVLVVAVVVIVFMNINGIIKSTVQTQASEQLKVPTTLGGVNLSLFGGSLSLKDLNIGSPEGFKAPEMFSLGGVDLKVNYGELRSQPIHIDTIHIDKPKLVLEQAGGKFNIKALMDQLPASPPSEPKAPGEERKDGEPIKLIIKDLRLSDATVSIRPGVGMNFPGVKEEYTIIIPTVQMNNIGSGEGNQNGAAIKDVTMMVMTELANKAKDSPQLPPELRQLLNLNVDQLAAQMKERLNAEVQKVQADLTNKVGAELGKAASDAMKNPKGATTTDSNALIQQGFNQLAKPKTKAPTTKPTR